MWRIARDGAGCLCRVASETSIRHHIAGLDALHCKKSPGADAQHRFGGNADSILRMEIVHTSHPGMSVFDVEQAPAEGARDHYIQSAADGEAGAIARDFGRPVAAL